MLLALSAAAAAALVLGLLAWRGSERKGRRGGLARAGEEPPFCPHCYLEWLAATAMNGVYKHSAHTH